jgi:hypothetical protein
MLNKSVYDGRSVVLVLSPLPPSRAMQSLARAIRERGSPFFDPYFVPSLAQRDYAVVEAGVTTDADVERLLRRAIADHLRRRQPPSSAVITHFR